LPYSEVLEFFGGARGSYLEFVDDLYHICDAGACGLDRMQQVMLQTFLSQNILPYADAAAMDSSAEQGMPFLDRDSVDLVPRLPAAFRVGRWPGGEQYQTHNSLGGRVGYAFSRNLGGNALGANGARHLVRTSGTLESSY
jgi:hypothetical protein